MKKKQILGAIGIAAIGTFGVIAPTLAYAATDTNTTNTFVEKLAAKLGIDVTTVQTAFDTTHDEIKSERDTERKAEIAQAVTDGTLTQRQADILYAMMDYQPEKPTEISSKEDLSSLTEEERKAKFDEIKTERDEAQVDALNNAGLNTTLEEVQSTMEAAQSAGLAKGPGFGRGGPGGPRPEMGL